MLLSDELQVKMMSEDWHQSEIAFHKAVTAKRGIFFIFDCLITFDGPWNMPSLLTVFLALPLNTSYLTNSYTSLTLKLESQ